MIVKPARLMLAMLAVIAAPSFAQNAATVNGKPIPQSKVDQVVKQVVAQGKGTDNPQLRETIKKDLISREVLIQEADKQGIGTRTDVKNAIDNARQSIMINAMLRDYVNKHPVTDAEIKAAYDQYKAQASNGKEYHAHHILVATEDEAKQIIAKLKGGAKFEDLAKQSKDPGSAANGGDLDWAPAENYVPEFSKALTGLQKGQVTETPVKTQFGFHVIRLDDTRAAKVATLEELKPQIVESLQQRKVAAFRDELEKKAKIK